jgi:hypothetical protein
VSIRREDRPGYAEAIWSEFCSRAKHERIISPAEFRLVERWMEQGIPLPVVFRGFDDFRDRPRRLEAMELPVQRAYEYWFQAMGGR